MPVELLPVRLLLRFDQKLLFASEYSTEKNCFKIAYYTDSVINQVPVRLLPVGLLPVATFCQLRHLPIGTNCIELKPVRGRKK